jgi:hypothetical protein
MHLKNLVLRAWWDGDHPSIGFLSEISLGRTGEYFSSLPCLVAPVKASTPISDAVHIRKNHDYQ